MKCLLIGGAQSVGKSETIYRLTKNLIASGFTDVCKSFPTTFQDFRVVLEGNDLNGNFIRIIINSPTDTPQIIHEFKDFFDLNGNYNILISSVRDDDFWPRNDFFNIMNINKLKNYILEIPLAKITRKTTNFPIALNWYQTEIDNTIKHILSNNPFNVL